MCGRLLLNLDLDALVQVAPWLKVPLGFKVEPNLDLCPGQMVPAVTGASRELELVRWGLVPRWVKDLKDVRSTHNARSDTVHEKPSYREAFRSRRAILIASGFLEWDYSSGASKGVRTLFQRADGQPLLFAGLWEEWTSPTREVVRSGTILTSEPNAFVARFHDRAPVILEPSQALAWLESGNDLATSWALMQPFAGTLVSCVLAAPAKPPKDGKVVPQTMDLFSKVS